jgi:hypothetical protein
MQFADLKDLLPSAEGSIRRRLLAGFVVMGAAIPVFWAGNLKEFLVASGLENATVALGALLVVYSVGLLSEIVGETVLLRAFGGAIWALEFPSRSIHAHTPGARWALRAAAYYLIVPAYAFWEGVRGLIGKSAYVADVQARLRTDDARRAFDRLPPYVRSGLTEPYGDGFDTAFQHLSATLAEAHRGQIQKLHMRNLETLALVSALCIALAGYFCMGVIRLRPDLESTLVLTFGDLRADIPALFLPLAFLLPIAVLAVHHRYTVSAVVNSVELLALEEGSSGPDRLPAAA